MTDPCRQDLFYELHIRPLFRSGDRDVLRGQCDPFDYEQAAAHRHDLLRFVSGDLPGRMPCGGPWPKALRDLLTAWYEGGCLKLRLGTGIYRAERHGDQVTIIAEGQWPGFDDDGFLDRTGTKDEPPEYTIYWKQRGDSQPTGRPFCLTASFQANPDQAQTVIIHDEAGTHTVAVTDLTGTEQHLGGHQTVPHLWQAYLLH